MNWQNTDELAADIASHPELFNEQLDTEEHQWKNWRVCFLLIIFKNI